MDFKENVLSAFKQAERVAHLLTLIRQHPDLEIMPLVAAEVVPSDDYGYWMADWGQASVEEYYYDEQKERIYIRSKDEDDLVDEVDVDDELDEDELADLTDEEALRLARERVAGYPWTRVTVVYIEPW